MASTDCPIRGFLADKTNCYSVLMVLTTLAFLAFMVAGTAALQVRVDAQVPAQDLPSASSMVRQATFMADGSAGW